MKSSRARRVIRAERQKRRMISEWYQILYSLGRRRWFIYRMVRYEDLHETIDSVLRIDGVEEIKIEIWPDGEED